MLPAAFVGKVKSPIKKIEGSNKIVIFSDETIFRIATPINSKGKYQIEGNYVKPPGYFLYQFLTYQNGTIIAQN